MSILRALFCCFDSSDPGKSPAASDPPRSNRSQTVVGRNETRSEHHRGPTSTNSADRTDHNPADHNPADHNSHYDAPSRPSSLMNHSIPLDYVNPNDENSAELALKGRRHSTSILSAQPPGPHSPKLPDGGSAGHPNDPHALTPGHNPPTSVSDNGHYMHPDESGSSLDAHSQALFGVPGGPTLLPPADSSMQGRKCLVLDLDETLVHSSFKYTWNADFVIPVEIEGTVHDVYVIKRPGVDEFLKKMSEIYEVVVFTASVAKYGDPLLDRLDPHGYVHHRLFRESCYNFNGSYVKNLATLGRPLPSVIIVDNSPAAYAFQPFNAVPVSSWFSDIHDNELLDMVPFLHELSTNYVPNVETVLKSEW